MKKIFRKEYGLWLKSAIVIIVFWCILVALLIRGYENNKATYLQTELESFQSKISATLKTYEAFSNYVFDEIVDSEDVLSIMYEANFVEREAQDILREKLYDLLIENYEQIVEYNFRQLHFHMPNSDSFLRFHKPSKYGDSLLGIRESVRLANEENRYVFGFEEGRIFNGYRFVYPLNYKDNAIGSVEVSISMASLIEILNQKYPKLDSNFIIDKSVVDSKVFDDEMDNYITPDYFDGYLFDKEVYETAIRTNDLMSKDDVNQLFKGFIGEFKDKAKENKHFSVIQKLKGKTYLIQFISIKNVSNQPVGYFVSVEENESTHIVYRELCVQFVFLLLVFIFILGASFKFVRDQIRINEISYRDQLTGLYNRHKFNELAEREFERNKRYAGNFTILMVDIDFFKKVNDTFGHLKGDDVLKALAQMFTEVLRVSDVVSRWGGEEFIFCLPNTSETEAIIVAEKIRKCVEVYSFEEVGHITVSIGCTLVKTTDSNLDGAIGRADEALYISKNQGRNRVSIK